MDDQAQPLVSIILFSNIWFLVHLEMHLKANIVFRNLNFEKMQYFHRCNLQSVDEEFSRSHDYFICSMDQI